MYLVKIRDDRDLYNQIICLVESKEWESDVIREAVSLLESVNEDDITKALLDNYSIHRENIDWESIEVAEFLKANLDPCVLVELYNLVKKLNKGK